ncbi:MAG: rRNA maturation RNase YbeY [Saprospiraceae bacterium]|nr:rRNA maturation RNase YbeY [Saprospiraceae bacterium]
MSEHLPPASIVSKEQPKGIFFHSVEVPFQINDEARIAEWVCLVIQKQGGSLGFLNIIFCGDEYLHRMNVEFLDHDTLTDIITFPYAELPLIEGELFISIDRVQDNAEIFKVPFLKELHRVIIHGVLHLCGQGDKTLDEQKEMRALENDALSIL